MLVEVTRHIKKDVERELWVRAAGRCQFDGCNKLLYKSSITQEIVNLAQKAHIYSFSKNGPRGWGPFSINKKGLNEANNLMLMCHGCHTKIDKDKSGVRYSAKLLINWKREHEQRVEIVTGMHEEDDRTLDVRIVGVPSSTQPEINSEGAYLSYIEYHITTTSKGDKIVKNVWCKLPIVPSYEKVSFTRYVLNRLNNFISKHS